MTTVLKPITNKTRNNLITYISRLILAWDQDFKKVRLFTACVLSVSTHLTKVHMDGGLIKSPRRTFWILRIRYFQAILPTLDPISKEGPPISSLVPIHKSGKMDICNDLPATRTVSCTYTVLNRYLPHNYGDR